MAISVLDSLYTSPPPDLSIILLAWTEESPTVVTINGVNPAGPSLTLVVRPITPHLQGSFSVPGGLLMGRAVGIEGQVEYAPPALIEFGGGSITFQFEVPAKVTEIKRMALHVPFQGGAAENVEALAYHWENESWEPLDLRTVPIQVQSSFPGGPPQPPPLPRFHQGVARLPDDITAKHTFSEALEGDVGEEEGLADYVSASGLVHVKLSAVRAHVGRPSLAIDGVTP